MKRGIAQATYSKRAFLRSAGGIAGVALLAACGQQGGESQSAGSSAPKSAGPVKITFWGTHPGAPTADEDSVKAFNATQQDVQVQYEFQGAYADLANKLTAALQANQAPDVPLLSDVWWFKFYLNKQLLPLDDYYKAEKVDTKDYVDSLFNEGVRSGKSYWVPFARSTPIFYYNKDVWSKAGLPDLGPKNWDEFVTDWTPKLKAATPSGKSFIIGDEGSYLAWTFQSIIWQFGGQYSDPNFTMKVAEPSGVKAGQFLHDSVKDGWAYRPKDANGDFRSGLTPSYIQSTATLAGNESGSKFPVGTAFLPEGPGGFGCCTGGSGMGILATTPNDRRQAAMKWIAYATGPKGTTTFSQATGYMPVRKSAQNAPEMQDFFKQHPNFKTAIDQLPKTRAQDSARVFVPNGDDIISKALDRITTSQEDPATVFKQLADDLNREAQPVIRQVKALTG